MATPTAPELEDLAIGNATETERAAAEVDRSLLRWSLGLTPSERLRATVRAGRLVVRLRRARA